MERVQVLIDKLVQQGKQGESAAQLLLTVQLLQQELLQLQQQSGPKPSGKVAVVMPFAAVNVGRAVEEKVEQKGFENVAEQQPAIEIKPAAIEAPVAVPAPEEKTNLEPAVVAAPAAEVPPQHFPYAGTPQPQIKETVEEVKLPEVVEAPQKGFKEDFGYALKRPQFTTHNEVKSIEETPQPAIVKEEEKTYFALTPTAEEEHHPFDAVAETPTLMQHTAQKDVNQKLSAQQLSLNDRLKQEQKEIAQKLVDTPIKDLRKAIGINDKFLFVDELFRGDDAMYERSIRTINNFHILPEAEYWINRELKVKLGWNDNKDTVQHFYHLVRRRFS